VSTLRDAALAYAHRGFHVFPLAPRAKEPLLSEREGGSGFKDATTNRDRIAAWWSLEPDANIGLHPGPSGLCVLDADGQDGLAAADSRGLLHPPTLQCLTGRPDGGRHLYFRRPRFRTGNRKLAAKLDVRCDDGYVVLSPSVHPGGAVYRWLGRMRDMRDVPRAVASELERLQYDPLEPQAFVGVSFTARGDEVDRRVRSYLRVVGSRAVGDRDNTAYRVARWLFNDMALDADSAWAYLAEWNRTNRPPLTSRELRAKVRSALKNGTRPRGSGLVRDYRTLPAFGGLAR
jgi:hypothetical protein